MNYEQDILTIKEFLKVKPKKLPERYRDQYDLILEEINNIIWLRYDKEINLDRSNKGVLNLFLHQHRDELEGLLDCINDCLINYEPMFMQFIEKNIYQTMVECIDKVREVEATDRFNYALQFRRTGIREKKREKDARPAVTIIDYSEKAIAVVGDTKPLKDQLKAARGRFNPFLKDQEGNRFAGWVFSKKRKEQVERIIN
jgi:hypothetical protein